MKRKISILTSGHPYYDERIFYKFARSLYKHGYDIRIIYSTSDSEIKFIKDEIHVLGFNGSNLNKTEKVNKFYELLKHEDPKVIFCCEPLPILAANRFKKQKSDVKVIYDVTEWYPENVAFKLNGIKKYLSYISLFLFNIIAANQANALIIGEKAKKFRYDLTAPFKRKQIIGYYPVLEFFDYFPPKFDKQTLILCYAGLLKFDRGIKTILKAANKFAELNEHIAVNLKFIGKFESQKEELEFKELVHNQNKIKVDFVGWTEYPKLSSLLSDVHICFDLREKNYIYSNSLPIKIFEYMACGKPFIFTDIKPIRDELDFSHYGRLVNPQDVNEIVRCIHSYVEDNDLLQTHAQNARRIIVEDKNWEKESAKLIAFIESL